MYDGAGNTVRCIIPKSITTSPPESLFEETDAEGKPAAVFTPKSPAPAGSPYKQWPNEIILNVSVDRADEERLAGQTRQILELFRKAYMRGGTVSTTHLAAISLQYGGRIFELRRFLVKRGYCVDLISRGANGVSQYAVVPLAKSVFYVKHREELDAEGSL